MKTLAGIKGVKSMIEEEVIPLEKNVTYLKIGINKRINVNILQHSPATCLLENGVNLRYIQELIRYKSIKTTKIYTHVSKVNLLKIKNPLNKLMKEGKYMILSTEIYYV